MNVMPRYLLAVLMLGVGPSVISADEPDANAIDVFNQRILPIFRSPNPSSCVQCHLASVDLKQYILPSHEQTFVSLRDQGLINLDAPDQSKILTLIRMGDKDADVGAKLIHEKTRKAEYRAFAAWVKACCNDERLRSLPKSNTLAKPPHADGVIRHARKSRIVDSFTRNIWSQRMRCFPCHTPHEIDPSNPKHKQAIKQQKKMAETFDEDTLKRMRFFHKTPEETLQYLLSDSADTPNNRLPLLNLQDPKRSLLLLKPLSKLPKRGPDKTFEDPTYMEPISHMGGLKMHKNDQSYKSFLAWIGDYANVTSGRYTAVDQLPADNWFPTQSVLRLKLTPDDWETGSVVQLFVFARSDRGDQAWSPEPIAFTQGTVTPRQMVNGALFLLPDTTSDADNSPPKLTAGDYLIKVFLDRNGRIEKDPTAMLNNDEFVGQAKLTGANWKPGFKFSEVLEAKILKNPSAKTASRD
jgi:hypothetical protein